jgi:hypothetical protein
MKFIHALFLLVALQAFGASRQHINTGTIAGDGTADPWKVAMTKANNNFVELFSRTDALATNTPAEATLGPLFLPVNVKDEPYNAVGNNVANDRLAIQAAIDAVAAAGGGTVYFPPSTGYYISGTLTNSHSNVVFDFGGNLIRGNANTPILKLIPQSLIDAGRYAGTDFPPPWLKAGAPSPVDGDAGTMMHEVLPQNRLVNVAVLNARCATDANFVYAYSTDDVVIQNCRINAANNSCIRAYNCQRWLLSGNNKFEGGTGSYTLFFFKSRDIKFTGNIVNSTAIRCMSFKGALHKFGTSIFEDLADSDFEDAGILIQGNTFAFTGDGIAFDWPPDSANDCGDAYSHTVGITKAQWYGRMRGIIVQGNSFTFTGTPAAGSGRYLWASYPHQNISVKNNITRDCGFFLAGVTGACIEGNQQYSTETSANAGFVQADTTTSHDASYVTIRANRFYNYHPANTGGGTDPQILYIDGWYHDITDNKFFGIGGAGMANAIVLGPIFDYSTVERNKGVADSATSIVPNPVLTVFGGTNNLHGVTSDNDFLDVSGVNTRIGGAQVFDTGAGTGFTIIRNGRYAGMAIKDVDKTTFLSQWYYDTNTSSSVLQHRDAAALTFAGTDGNSVFKNYLTLTETSDPTNSPAADKGNIYLKDDGTGTRAYLQTSAAVHKLAEATGDKFTGRVKVVDQGDGASLQMLMSNDTTGYGGWAIRSADETLTKVQGYYDAVAAAYKLNVVGNTAYAVDGNGVIYVPAAVVATNGFYLFSTNGLRWHLTVSTNGAAVFVQE